MQTNVPQKENEFRGHLRVSRAAGEEAKKIFRLLEEDSSPSARLMTSRPLSYEKAHVHYMEKFESGKWVPMGFSVLNGGDVIYLALFPDFRGRGLAVHALKAAVTHLYQYPIFKLTAYISPGDRASRRTFESCGFVREGEKSGQDEAFFEYVLPMRITCPCYNIFI